MVLCIGSFWYSSWYVDKLRACVSTLETLKNLYVLQIHVEYLYVLNGLQQHSPKLKNNKNTTMEFQFPWLTCSAFLYHILFSKKFILMHDCIQQGQKSYCKLK